MEELEEKTYQFRLPFRLHNFPIEIEDLAGGPLAIVSGILGAMIHLQIAQLFPNLGAPDQRDIIVAAWILLGGLLGMVGSVKVIFWLDDQIQEDRRKLQRTSERNENPHL